MASLGDQSREFWRLLLRLNPKANDARLALAESLGTSGLSEARTLLKVIEDDPQSTYLQRVEAARINGKLGMRDRIFSSAELNTIAALGASGTAGKSTTAPSAKRSAPGFYWPIYAVRVSATSEPVPLSALRQALFLRPLSDPMENDISSRLFFALIKELSKEHKPGLVIDLFEQYGLASSSVSSFRYLKEAELPDTSPIEDETSLNAQWLPKFSLSVAEKAALTKTVIEAYRTLGDLNSAADTAQSATVLGGKNREVFAQLSREFRLLAKRTSIEWSARLSISDVLGEELSQRRPSGRPRRGRIRT